MTECWICDSTDVVYQDVLKMWWCNKCYSDIYLKGSNAQS